jgi:hypothetical protein
MGVIGNTDYIRFWNFRTKEEMPWWKRLIWRGLGERRFGESDGVRVTAYRFFGVTLIWKIEGEGV